jgi:hypothetical protein
MALPDLHNFERLVKNKPAKGSNDYPVAIKAKHLDENWKMTTLLEGTGEPKLYEVEYTKEGTRITRILPEPPASGTHVLGAIDGTIQWIATEDCE